ncbi:MAG: ABC transporter ATP-binding protein [Solirubrobacteraceae bacterium]
MTATDPGLELDGLHARAGRFALGPVDLRVGAGKVLVVLGPSGAGKTTLLNTIAGFGMAGAGRISLAGRELARLAPERRGIGVVFQHGALFPHLSVRDNIGFGPRARGGSPARVDRLLARFGLDEHANRRPGTLSGGERQRVALARALASNPDLLLLDEPLSALDQPTREELRGVLRELLSGLNIPAVHVTHDRDEALSLADEIAVIVGGQMRQLDVARKVAARPADADVARLLGWTALGRGQLRDGAISLGDLRIQAPGALATGPVEVLYRPEAIVLEPPDGTSLIRTVAELVPTVPLARVLLDGDPPLTVLALARELEALDVRPGRPVGVRVDVDAVSAFGV